MQNSKVDTVVNKKVKLNNYKIKTQRLYRKKLKKIQKESILNYNNFTIGVIIISRRAPRGEILKKDEWIFLVKKCC